MSPRSRSGTRFSRRRFLVASGAAVSASLLAGSALASAVSPLRVGLIGGDSDGISLVSRALRADQDFRLVAIADEIDTRAKRALDIFTHPMRRGGAHPQIVVSPESLFVGDGAAERLCARDDLDVVFAAGIPAFRPAHVAAAIAAGKHVFMLGPGAIDIAGCIALENAARQAERLGLSIGVDLGEDSGPLLGPGPVDVRWQRAPWRRTVVDGDAIANWYFAPALSGGALLTEGFGIVDRLNQLKRSTPALADGRLAGGLEDYAVRFIYPDGSPVTLHLSMGHGLPTEFRANSTDAAPFSLLSAAGRNPISAFLEGLRLAQTPDWRPKFDRLVTSTQTAILGREAARAGHPLGWGALT